IAAVALVIGVVVYAMTRAGEPDPNKVSKADPPKHVTVENLPPQGSAAEAATPGSNVEPHGSIVVAPPTNNGSAHVVGDAAIHVDTTNPAQTHPKKNPHKHVETHKQPLPEHVELTRDQVASKFSSVKRDYDAYKAKNGARLDGDWNDL